MVDPALADWGRKEICIAETEIPDLMALREEYAGQRPLAGARVTLHVCGELSERPVARVK